MRGCAEDDVARVLDALASAGDVYADKRTQNGQSALEFSVGVAQTLSFLRSDAETRIAGLMFELTLLDPQAATGFELRFGQEVVDLVSGIRQLIRLRELTAKQQAVGRGKNAAQEAVAQVETLRKMLLAMARDMRVVLVCLAACGTAVGD